MKWNNAWLLLEVPLKLIKSSPNLFLFRRRKTRFFPPPSRPIDKYHPHSFDDEKSLNKLWLFSATGFRLLFIINFHERGKRSRPVIFSAPLNMNSKLFSAHRDGGPSWMGKKEFTENDINFVARENRSENINICVRLMSFRLPADRWFHN